MKFIDEVPITIESGHGGPGKISWRREKFVPRGGPDGGDGGKGGNLVFRVNNNLNSLIDYRFRKTYAAENGDQGHDSKKTGRDGLDLILDVPPGTVVKSQDGKVLVDLGNLAEPYVLLQGGRGGKGNHFFKTSINQAPRYAQPGEPGEKLDVMLELKLIADVGIIGFPNAGKSTLISRISAAKPKIADYPFTTLTPSLGVVRIEEFKSMVVADIPGLVPGAHKGVGLGIRFLKHIERTRCFIHLIDSSELSGRDPIQDYQDINNELAMYDEHHSDKDGFLPLKTRTQIVVLNKMDLLNADQREDVIKRFSDLGVKTHQISGVSGEGLRDLIFELGKLVLE